MAERFYVERIPLANYPGGGYVYGIGDRDAKAYPTTHPNLPSKLTERQAKTRCNAMNADWRSFLAKTAKAS